MKQFSVTIEHRSFNLNIQEQYYDKLIELFSKNTNINLKSNNTLASILYMCVENAIETIDLQNEIKQQIDKLNQTDALNTK